MSKSNDGGPAFPKSGNYESDNNSPDYDSKNQDGMSLRDYFAAHAPSDAHRWLPVEWEFDEPAPIKPTGYDYHRAGGSAGRDEAMQAECDFEKARALWSKRRDIALFVACRWAYADAMLEARAK